MASRSLLRRIRKLLQSKNWGKLKEVFQFLHPEDIADILQSLDKKEREEVFHRIPKEKVIEVFERLDVKDELELLEGMDLKEAKKVLEEMAPDERADLFEELSREEKEDFLKILEKEKREDVEKLLSYPENSAASIMTTEVVVTRPWMTVEETLEELRKQKDKKEDIYYLYVIDEENRVVGVLSLKDLIFNPGYKKIEEIMNPQVIKIKVDEDKEEAAKKLEKYDLMAVPVVDEEDRLQGVITVDDAVETIEEEVTEDMLKMASMEAPEEEYFQTPLLVLIRKRIVWLIALLLAQTISSLILKGYSFALQSMVALAYFIPMLSGTAGNTGAQTSTIVIRGLATGEISLIDILKLMKREILAGLVIGIVLGGVGALRAFIFERNILLTSLVGLALGVVVIIGNLGGVVFPLLFKRLKLDPAVATGPFLATLMDILSLLIYFHLAVIFLRFVGTI